MPLLFIMYSVFQNGPDQRRPDGDADGLRRPGRRRCTCTNIDPVTGVPDAALEPVHRHGHPVPRRRSTSSLPSTFFSVTLGGFVLGLSILAIVSAAPAARPVADDAAAPTRTNDDPNTRIQRQTMLLLPLISVVYGGFLPAGLFIYWITATIFSIVQQYLIVGWGGMFPLFGWTPGFAMDHTPRFPVVDATTTRAQQARGRS